jgi:hypothetical protein
MRIGGKAREGSISAVVTRADGRVENLGIICYWSRNPVKHWIVNQWIKVKERRRKTNGRAV